MVEKKIISKTIGEAILKCSQRLSINKNTGLMTTMEQFRKETCNPKKPRKTEKGILVNTDGEVLIETKGNKTSVTYNSQDIIKSFEQNGELHVEHNHPLYENPYLPVFLSGEDIWRLRDKVNQYKNGVYSGDFVFKSITAEGANGTRMTLVRGDNYSDEDNNKLSDLIKDYENEIISEYKKYDVSNKEFSVSEKFYEIRDKWFDEHPDVDSITDEQRLQFYAEAEKQVFKRFDPTPIFRKYKKSFRELNMNLTWEENL